MKYARFLILSCCLLAAYRNVLAQSDGVGYALRFHGNGANDVDRVKIAIDDPTTSDPYLVIGVEKHDAGPQYPSFSGWIDEVRLSKTIRHWTHFTRTSAPFSTDPQTVALYHFDEGDGDLIQDTSGAPGRPSHGVRRFGCNPPGPE